MDFIELKDQQRYGRGYFDKYNNEEDRKSEESQKNADVLRDMELQKRHEIRIPENLQGLFTARFSKTGKFIATGFGNGAIQIRNGKTGELTASLKSGLEISMPIMCCRFNPVHKDIFYASSACGNIFMCNTHTKEFSRFIFELKNEIWDIRVSTGSIRVIKGPHICGDAIDICETRILTGSWIVRDSLQIWDLMSAKLIETINPQNRLSTLNGEFLYAVQYLDGDPYGDLILTGGSGISALEVISLREKKVMESISVNKPIFTIDSHQNIIIFGGIESVLRLGDYY